VRFNYVNDINVVQDLDVVLLSGVKQESSQRLFVNDDLVDDVLAAIYDAGWLKALVVQPTHVKHQQFAQFGERQTGLRVGRQMIGDELCGLFEFVDRTWRNTVETTCFAADDDGSDGKNQCRRNNDGEN
jgi:hypothetical protein